MGPMKSAEFVITNEFSGDDHEFVVITVSSAYGGPVAKVTIDAGTFNKALAKPGTSLKCAVELGTVSATR